MMSRSKPGFVALVAGLAPLLCLTLLGQGSEAPPPKAATPGDTKPEAGADEVQDPDARNLGAAINTQDAPLLADVALKLLAGERSGGQPAGKIPTKEVLKTAIRLAAVKHDTATLDRLAQAVKGRDDPELTTLLAIARKTAQGKRSAEAGLLLSAEDTSPDAFAQCRRYLQQIEAAKLLGDRETLDALADGLGNGAELSEKQRGFLAARIEAARKATPEQPDPDSEALRKLTRATRGSDESASPPQEVTGAFLIDPRTVNLNGLPGRNRAVWTFCKNNLGRRVGNGQCAVLDQSAIAYATGRPFTVTPSGLNAD
jgi:hypothetical protein